MAFTEFCCRSGGSNLNAGTRTGNSTEPGTAADLTYASGNWVSATGVFTVAAGDPVADGVAVGDFASVYADGASVTTLVGRVTARTTTTITVSTTAKTGTTTDGTGNRTLKIGGAWLGPNAASGFPLTFLSAAATNVAAELPRINLKNDATYSVTASVAPSTTQNGLHLQGYTTSYGDGGRFILDGGTSGASYNLFAPVVNKFTVIDGIFCNNGATGAAHGVAPSPNVMFFRCVVHNVRGIGFFQGRAVECEAYACNASNTSGYGGFYGMLYAERCIAHDNTGSNTRGFANTNLALVECIADTNGSHGFDLAASGHMSGCNAYNNGGDGISITGTTSEVSIVNCNLIKNTGYGINAASNVPGGAVLNCGFGSGTQANGSGTTNGIGMMTVIGSVTYASDVTPWTDPANGDFRISLAAAKGTGRGTFTQTASSYAGAIGYPDIGAAQHQDAGGGGGIPIARGMHGGMR